MVLHCSGFQAVSSLELDFSLYFMYLAAFLLSSLVEQSIRQTMGVKGFNEPNRQPNTRLSKYLRKQFVCILLLAGCLFLATDGGR